MRVAAIVFLILALPLFSAEDGNDFYSKGLDALRQAQSDHAALVPATKLLAKAAELYEAAGNDARAAEVNSCLYWAKKKMTLADSDLLKENAGVVSKLESIAKPLGVADAQQWFDRANAYAKTQPDPLLVAVRYYEVGDRFKDSDAGRAAIDLSLKAMQHIGEKIKPPEYKPAATDGKLYVQSAPVGAAIILITPDGRMDTQKKTPALVQIPKGMQTLSIEMSGMVPFKLNADIGETISKTEIVKLQPITISADIILNRVGPYLSTNARVLTRLASL